MSPQQVEAMSEKDLLERFEEKIDRGQKIEPGDWMPEAYRKQLIRMISQHAHSEVVGMLPEGGWITRAPTLRRKLVLLAKVQDEAGHGEYLYHAAETLGISRQEMIDQLLSGQAKYSNIFNYPTLSWADIGIIGYFVDGAAIMNQTMLARCSYGPYARANIRISAEESFHFQQGKEIVILLSQGSNDQKAMLQDAVDRWWWPTLMMFGPHDDESPNSPMLIRWKIKTKTNDELRQNFVDQMVPEIHAMGLTLPDPDLIWDEESKRWAIGPIDWDEFWKVIKGDGPCNQDRISARRNAEDNGRWVREALEAYADRSSNGKS